MGAEMGAWVGLFGLLATGVGVWVSLRERLARVETKIETLERYNVDQKSEIIALREWLETQFTELRHRLDRKVDK